MATRKNIRTGMLAGGVAIAMVGLSYAAVPLYQLFCQVTGFGGTTQRAEEAALPGAAQVAALHGRTIDVRFDGNVMPEVPWTFKPVQAVTTVKIGERKLAFYRATNNSDRTVTGTAAFNVTPDTAGKYFVKIDCFCFRQQTLKPGQTVDMPVTYYIDPAILDDPNGRRIEEITLSYTFFPSQPAEGEEPTETARAIENKPSAPKEG